VGEHRKWTTGSLQPLSFWVSLADRRKVFYSLAEQSVGSHTRSSSIQLVSSFAPALDTWVRYPLADTAIRYKWYTGAYVPPLCSLDRFGSRAGMLTGLQARCK